MKARLVTSVTSPSAPVRTFSFHRKPLAAEALRVATTASAPEFLIASSTRWESGQFGREGFSMRRERRRSTAARIGSDVQVLVGGDDRRRHLGSFQQLLKIRGDEIGLRLVADQLGALGLEREKPLEKAA